MTGPCVMLVAAEASGDALGAALAGALRTRGPAELRLVGVGGPRMAEQGVCGPVDIAPLSVLGVFDALRAWPAVLRLADQTAAFAAAQKADLVVLIDSWGFTLRVARRLRHLRPRPLIVKYVAPQVWATRPGRARTLARVADHLLTIHAFDAPWFQREGLPVTFVGNPALSRSVPQADVARLGRDLGIAPGQPSVLLLPGSRRGEIDRLLPLFEQAAMRLTSQQPDLRLILAPADGLAADIIARVRGWRQPPRIVEGQADRLAAMRLATAALACSGTVTTELAIAGCPMVVAYRLGPLTHAIVKRLIRTRFITLFNVAAQDFVAPEFVQNACTGPALAEAVRRRLDDPVMRQRQIEAQSAALEIMRGGIVDPAGTAADAIIRILAAGRGARA